MAQHYPGISGRIHSEDMLTATTSEALHHYAAVGATALDQIEVSLAEAGSDLRHVHRCLDLPCGYGRVLRWLVTRIEPSAVTACDIDPSAVRFCAREFGATPLLSDPDLRLVRFPTDYDLVWVGSLLTHLKPADGLEMLRVISGQLRPGGVLVFTTHGTECLDILNTYGPEFALAEDRFRHDLSRNGAAFVPYAGNSDYGIAIHEPASLRNMVKTDLPQLDELRFEARGWDGHQDVWAYVRAG